MIVLYIAVLYDIFYLQFLAQYDKLKITHHYIKIFNHHKNITIT